MAIPVYQGVGTANRQTSMETPLVPTCPATVNAGDLLLLWITNRSNASETYTFSGAGTWITQFSISGAGPQFVVAYKVADGTEAGQTVTCTASAGTLVHRAAIFRFSGVDTGGPIFGGASNGYLTAQTVLTGLSVTSVAADRLAVNLLASNAAQVAIGDLTGMTGGTWGEVFFATTNENPTCSMQVAPMPGAGTITGGSVSGMTSANFRRLGFALIGVSPERARPHNPMRTIRAM